MSGRRVAGPLDRRLALTGFGRLHRGVSFASRCSGIGMTLPPRLLEAITASGRVSLVVGAGCSFERPTGLPLAAECSSRCHADLVSNGDLAVGDCPDPSDLSILADAVIRRTGSQGPLVRMLDRKFGLRTAMPNEGHQLAAALLAEHSIGAVVTLNFDLALTTAIALLGVGQTVGVINGPRDFPKQEVVNLYYLHRNANEVDEEAWVLRTDALMRDWRNGWEEVVVKKVLSAPVVVFAGLGSPSTALLESARLIRERVPNGSQAFQVDPGDPNASKFFTASGLALSNYIRLGWCEFMRGLAERVVADQVSSLEGAASALANREHLVLDDIAAIRGAFKSVNLVTLGRLRAGWPVEECAYARDEGTSRELLADLLLAAALIARVAGASVRVLGDGLIHFYRGNRLVASYLLLSGRGTRGWAALEAQLAVAQRRLRSAGGRPNGAVIAGTRSTPTVPVSTPPADVVSGDTKDDILLGDSALPMHHVDWIRMNDDLCRSLAP